MTYSHVDEPFVKKKNGSMLKHCKFVVNGAAAMWKVYTLRSI